MGKIRLELLNKHYSSNESKTKKTLSKHVLRRAPLAGKPWFDSLVFKAAFGEKFRADSASRQSLLFAKGRTLAKLANLFKTPEEIQQIVQNEAPFANEPILLARGNLSLSEIHKNNQINFDPQLKIFQLSADCLASVLVNHPKTEFDVKTEHEAIRQGLYIKDPSEMPGPVIKLGKLSLSPRRVEEAVSVIEEIVPKVLMAAGLSIEKVY